MISIEENKKHANELVDAMNRSANLDRLSLHINKELNIATSEPEAVNALKEQLFEPDFQKCRELT